MVCEMKWLVLAVVMPVVHAQCAYAPVWVGVRVLEGMCNALFVGPGVRLVRGLKGSLGTGVRDEGACTGYSVLHCIRAGEGCTYSW